MRARDDLLDTPDDGYRHPDAMPSYNSAHIEVEARAAQEQHEQAGVSEPRFLFVTSP